MNNMTTAEKKMLSEILREVREVRALVEPKSHAIKSPQKKAKKMPAWLRASLKDVEEGRVSGPFDTVEELVADLNGPGK